MSTNFLSKFHSPFLTNHTFHCGTLIHAVCFIRNGSKLTLVPFLIFLRILPSTVHYLSTNFSQNFHSPFLKNHTFENILEKLKLISDFYLQISKGSQNGNVISLLQNFSARSRETFRKSFQHLLYAWRQHEMLEQIISSLLRFLIFPQGLVSVS